MDKQSTARSSFTEDEIRGFLKKYQIFKKHAWSASTHHCESYRLPKYAPFITGSPTILWDHLEKRKMAKSSRANLWTRVTDFWNWMEDNGHVDTQNPYSKWRRQNPRLFRNAYTRRLTALTMAEAEALINKIPRHVHRKKAFQLLYTGMRWNESFSLKKNLIIGKGDKTREVFCPKEFRDIEYNFSHTAMHRQLKRVGLNTHMLRKIFLSHLANNGANGFDLCAIAGWSSLSTAQHYIQTSKPRLQELVNSAQTNAAAILEPEFKRAMKLASLSKSQRRRLNSIKTAAKNRKNTNEQIP